MRRGFPATVALLLVLAGCLGTPAPTGTDGPANTTSEPTPTEALLDDTATPTASRNTPTAETVEATFLVDGDENVTVTLEVADDPAERSDGLMYRRSLPKNHGMVFVYDDAAMRSFWMKNTYIPLDMVFVGPDREVLNVRHAAVQPNASDSDLRRYSSDGEAQYVIELSRGFANRTGVGPGTEVVFEETPWDGS